MSRPLQLLSQSAVNSRASIVGGRPSMAPKERRLSAFPRGSLGGRESLAGRSSIGRPSSVGTESLRGSLGGTGRRSSVYARSGPGKLLDPRPLTDKAYLTGCATSVITYLTSHGYDKPVGPKTFQSPTTSDFRNILAFLVSKFDPTYVIPEKNFADVTVNWFKLIKYPFPVSKAALSSVGAPHTWPSTLVSLSWLTELLDGEETIENSNLSPFHAIDAETRMFWDTTARAYRCFLTNTDSEQVNEIISEMISDFQRRKAAVMEQMQALVERRAGLTRELNELTAMNELERINAAVAKFEDDLEKMNAFTAVLTQGIRETQQQTAKFVADTEAREMDLAQTQAERARLKRIVDTQEVGPAEAARLERDRQMLEAQVNDAAAALTAAQQLQGRVEVEGARRVEEVNRKIQQYAQLANAVQIVPITARNSNNINYELSFNVHAKPDQMLSQDVKYTLLSNLMRFKERAIETSASMGDEQLGLKERLDRMQETVAEREESLSQLTGRLKKLEAKCKQDKETADEEVRQRVAETERLEQAVVDMRAAAVAAVSQSETDLRSAEREHQLAVERMAAEREAMQKALCEAATMLAEHKEFVRRRLVEVEQHTRAAKLEIEAAL